MLLKIIINTLKRVLFSDDKSTHEVHNICCAVGLKLTCGAILLQWFWPERASVAAGDSYGPQYRSFSRSCRAKTLNWGKWWVKKFNLAPFALRTQSELVYGARNTSVCLALSLRMMKLSRAEKQAVESHIVSHVSEKLWKSTKRSNVMIQMNSRKIDIYISRRTVFYKEEINCGAKIWYQTQAFLFLRTWNKG